MQEEEAAAAKAAAKTEERAAEKVAAKTEGNRHGATTKPTEIAEDPRTNIKAKAKAKEIAHPQAKLRQEPMEGLAKCAYWDKGVCKTGKNAPFNHPPDCRD